MRAKLLTGIISTVVMYGHGYMKTLRPSSKGNDIRKRGLGTNLHHKKRLATFPSPAGISLTFFLPFLHKQPIEIVPRLCISTLGFHVVINTQSSRFFKLPKYCTVDFLQIRYSFRGVTIQAWRYKYIYIST